MSNTDKRGRIFLERHYEDVVKELESLEINFPKAKHFDIPELNNSGVGNIMRYLSEQDVISIYTYREGNPNVYDMTDYDPANLDELKDELELD